MGVLTLGIPTQVAVLTSVFGRLTPYEESYRAMSKVRNGERGRGGVERRLVALGARPRDEGEPGRAWLEEALQAVGARIVAHDGNHKYAAYIGPRTGRRLTATSYPYPKANQGGAAA